MKQPNRFGRWAITTAILSCVLFFVALGNLALHYMNRTSTAGDIRFVIVGAQITLGLAAIGIVLSVISFFRRNEKKGLSVSACILSVLLLLLSGILTFSYHYMFGTLEQDGDFADKDLLVVSPEDGGVIDLSPVPPETVLPPEEVKQKLQILQMEHLVNWDIPERVLTYMDRYDPVQESILRPGSDQIRNYLLFGLDDVNSSDTVLLISLDSLHKKVKMFSLPRDTYVLIPQWGTYTKLTYAYSAGGAAMAVGTVNYNLSLNVTDYVSVKFDDVKTMIDYVGGVTVNMGYAEWDYMTQCRFEGLTVGPCHLDGEAGLYYMRLRETDSELRRTERQREVLAALYQSALQLPVEQFPELVRKGMDLCTTSMDSYDLLGLLLEAMQGNYTLEQYGLLDLVEYWGGQFSSQEDFYVVYDLDYAADTLYRLIYEDYYISGYDTEEEGT